MKLSVFATALLALSTTVAMTQTHPNIQQRKNRQQARIAQGVRSGQLTPRETAHLERRETSINRQERNMRRADGGHLTRADRARLNARQNRTSRAIYNKKHNAAVRH
jgi:hypothetical protein